MRRAPGCRLARGVPPETAPIRAAPAGLPFILPHTVEDFTEGIAERLQKLDVAQQPAGA